MRDSAPEPVAVVGMGCRFPGDVDDPRSYWNLLSQGRDALVDIPRERWQVEKFYDAALSPGTACVRRGGFLGQPVDRFDASFFGISPREACHIDPQQRLLLEVAWEALENGGITLERIAGSPVGVFVGGFTLDYSQLQFGGAEGGRDNLAAHTATGVVMGMLANRISHALDLTGPSLTVDTACSSSLVAIHLACQSIWSGESSAALAGGVNLMLSPNFTIAASQGGFLSPTSRSCAFDAEADGYVRGEGAGIVVLEPLSRAKREGDPIYALIRATAVTQDGRTSGITVPSADSQERAMRCALACADVDPSTISYVEAHGTGTPLGDPIEANAIGHVYGGARRAEDRCLIGSVKTNIGHLEAAAGVAGLIKAVLCLQHREVPPHLHLSTLNPQIDLERLGLGMPQPGGSPLASEGTVRVAVNSFGFGGTNAHALLESAPDVLFDEPDRSCAPIPGIFALAARSTAALRGLTASYVELLDRGESSAALASAVAHRRTHHRQARLAVVMHGSTDLRHALASVESAQLHPAVHLSSAVGDSPAAFVFTGMGPQWWGMGRALLASSQVFRTVIERCDAALAPLAGWSLLGELTASEEKSRMSQTAISQPANFALQIALAAVWSQLGVRPQAVVGHSAGEIAAAYVAGALTFEDAVTVIFHRARLQHLTAGEGRLMAVALSDEQASELPAVCSGRLTLGAVNSPGSVALVGAAGELEILKLAFDEKSIFCRLVDGDVPYHSPAMGRLEGDLRLSLAAVSPRAPKTALYSTVTAGTVSAPIHDVDYWWRNVREPVRFGDAALAMVDDGITTFVEIGPHPVLGHALGECLRARARRGVIVPSLRRGANDATVIAHSCAELYVAGYQLDWDALHPRRPTRALPRYPWQRERHWIEADESRRDRLGELEHPLLGNRRDTPSPAWRRQLDGSRPAYLADHRVMDLVVFPGAGYVEMALSAGRAVFGASRCVLEDVCFDAPVVLRGADRYVLDTTLDPATGRVEIYGHNTRQGDWVRHARARLAPARADTATVALEQARARCPQEWDGERCYERFRQAGFDYGLCFQSIERMWVGGREAIARLNAQAVARQDEEELMLHPVVLDACFQALLPLAASAAPGATLLPIGAGQIVFDAPPSGELWAVASASELSRDELAGDILLVTADGLAVVEVRDFRVRAIAADRQERRRFGTRWLHELVWEEQDAPQAVSSQQAAEPGTWLVLGDARGLADALAAPLTSAGQELVVARPGTVLRRLGPDRFELRPDRRGDFDAVIEDLATRTRPPVRGVLHLWSHEAAQRDLTTGKLSWPTSAGPLSVIHLVQALDAAGLAWPLTIVTVGAQPVDGRIGLVGLLQSPLWGMGRVLHHESLSLQTRMIDLDPDTALEDVGLLAQELLWATSDEDQIAWRASKRLVGRLQPSKRESGSLPLAMRPDASYLITGGLGALGLVFARWLAVRGARRIVLVGRSQPPARDSWRSLAADHPCRPQVEAIEAIEALGATVELASLDVAGAGDLRTYLDTRIREGLPALRGAIHCAGAVHDQVLLRMDRAQLESVMRPKVAGAWALHEALAGAELDFFVLFSSVSSVLATVAQGNYAAANSFLDALAHYRRGLGLPALSIGWGPWDAGMIAQLGLQSLYEQRGIDLIGERVGLDVFEELLGSPEAQQFVLSAHWPTLIASYPIVPRLIEHLGRKDEQATSIAGAGGASVRERLDAAPPEEQPAIIAEGCAEIVGGVLRVDPALLPRDEPLNLLGLESMIAVELRIRLEQALGVAPTLIFLLQGASCTDIAELVHGERLAQDETEATPESVATLLAQLDAATADQLLAEIESSPSAEPTK